MRQRLQVLRAEKILADYAWDAMKGTGRPKLVLTRGALLTPKVLEDEATGKVNAATGPDDLASDLAEGAKRLAA